MGIKNQLRYSRGRASPSFYDRRYRPPNPPALGVDHKNRLSDDSGWVERTAGVVDGEAGCRAAAYRVAAPTGGRAAQVLDAAA